MDRRIEAILVKIDAKPSRRLTVGGLARSVNLSSSRLRHLFKQETGKTLTQYLKIVRVRRGEILLRTTFRSVKEIANDVGFGSSSTLSREFKKLFGTSPTLYRFRFGPSTNECSNQAKKK